MNQPGQPRNQNNRKIRITPKTNENKQSQATKKSMQQINTYQPRHHIEKKQN